MFQPGLKQTIVFMTDKSTAYILDLNVLVYKMFGICFSPATSKLSAAVTTENANHMLDYK